VDLGVKTMAALSDGAIEPDPHQLRSRLKQPKRLQRAISRTQDGGRNRRKAAQRLGKLHRTVANQRANTLHQFTSRLAKTTSVVMLENRNVVGMAPPSGASDWRCGVGRVAAATDLHGGVVWLSGARRQSLGAVVEDLFWVRLGG
jgi:putative transposase